jgi:hypothetical protein
MTRTLIVVAAFLTLSVPAALAVPPEDKGKPDNPGNSAAAPGQSAGKNAAKAACKAARGTSPSTITAFKDTYGTNKNKSNAFGKCVSSTLDNAAKKCKKLKKDSPDEFKTQYGYKPNAFGKCVSAMVKKSTTS